MSVSGCPSEPVEKVGGTTRKGREVQGKARGAIRASTVSDEERSPELQGLVPEGKELHHGGEAEL